MAPQGWGNYVSVPQGGQLVREGGSLGTAFHQGIPTEAQGAFAPHTGCSD